MISKYIFGFENWKKVYSSSSFEEKTKTWVFVKTSDSKEIYLREYADWLSFKDYIDKHSVEIHHIGLRYKSNSITIDTSECDGVYLVRSIKGEFGGKTRQCFTIGKIVNNQVEKTMWITPELIEDSSYVDNIENCFEEAIIYHGTKKQ